MSNYGNCVKHRRDSFITHRAFCDALAEETARVKVGTTVSNNFNYNSMGGGCIEDKTGLFTGQHFGSILKPILVKEATMTIRSNVQMIGGPMMMYGEDGVWGNQLTMGDYYINHNQNQGLMMNNGGVSSLYSHQLQQMNQTKMGNMSATALLQKAAEIGPTCTTTTTTRSTPSLLQLQQGFLFNNGSEFCNSSSTTSRPIIVVENENNGNGNEMYTAKQRRTHSEFECGSGSGSGITGIGETREQDNVLINSSKHSITIELTDSSTDQSN
ncbi:zinc finger protein NUTCRACKER-like [Benincasa hispida]|uniref:zinc finger protein NUTCRACKER-like n=1 Tax=Benincasa hispida TaxID=102211 RepID=UPI001900EFB4|nr:zinc finger protein NUTCRACKER-like [Benincasa hispida]